MTSSTDYGTWSQHNGLIARTVAETVAEFVDYDAARFNIPALAEAYRAMIEAALPSGISFDGERFTSADSYTARETITAAIESVDLHELSSLYDTGSSLEPVQIYEDNSGAVYIGPADVSYAWALGPVTLDLAGRAASDAQAWQDGDWKPGDGDVTPAQVADLPVIATWSMDTGLVHVRGDNGERIAGAGGSRYLGIEL